MQIIFLGAPGSGKGTHSLWIEKELNIPHISTGDIFRKAISEKTKAGILAKSYIDQGKLCPDDVTLSIVEERLNQDDCKKGFLLDGFPRTIVQAKAFEELLKKLEISLNCVLYLDVDYDILLDRITGRLVCPKCGASYHKKNLPPKVEGKCDECDSELIQRKDDNEATMKVRLDTYEKETAPLVEYYKNNGKLVRIDAMKDFNNVKADIYKVLKR